MYLFIYDYFIPPKMLTDLKFIEDKYFTCVIEFIIITLYKIDNMYLHVQMRELRLNNYNL